MNKLLSLTFILPLMLLSLAACNPKAQGANAEKQQEAATRKLTAEANRQIGMPDIVNFQERRFAKQILEMRDKALSTYTYFIDMNGKKHFICESVGYGLPYSVQFTNPVKVEGGYESRVTVPQADPNGLYMPEGLAATWVICASDKGNIAPVYVEPQIMVSPFKMH